MRRAVPSQIGAAAHCPAGHFSPYSDREKGALIDDFANRQRRQTNVEAAAISLLPVTIRGEGAGRRMRGGADA
ncbi:hypothetical protein EN858_16095 [Mesorhizobium sp. M4B.F.Ca.ET.215.01.1.1]|nr:hypothetical protein EOA34_05625 [Mesorhizobium sp. M4B.F.Ca.ET.013.02.1.1]RUW75510.1 hypothetical protein EOA31_08885 [Mesorhizobium sp. M4B.F.Ca.ET.049.02.1.2]RVD42308.1 hypothetical protein EN741_12390 [Mesorhizobium sp. M4B.F.Ca.ET.019.03.1.1]RWF63794.1 MAG: hypothetical protein EOS47_17560 [Mesorhizobium sp.]RWX67883.1 hypothetical protein EN780_10925 [Mesorhizobium sp. M4B.F.Ca.ET.089.01.1.1]TGQ10598.1 hypothetical protein EN858_16095 [Mesorhizobium sp. M4B.F.Ca.ET.215.01.1.1]TGQ3618